MASSEYQHQVLTTYIRIKVMDLQISLPRWLRSSEDLYDSYWKTIWKHITAISSNFEAHIEETLWDSLVKIGHTTKTMHMILLNAYADDQKCWCQWLSTCPIKNKYFMVYRWKWEVLCRKLTTMFKAKLHHDKTTATRITYAVLAL